MRLKYDVPFGRQQIRKRWQITIPRALREHLHLYQGQLLNWDLVEDELGNAEIRIYPGEFRRAADMAAYQSKSASKRRKKARDRCAKKIRKSDIKEAVRILLEHGEFSQS